MSAKPKSIRLQNQVVTFYVTHGLNTKNFLAVRLCLVTSSKIENGLRE